MEPNWGMLAKNQEDPETIEEAIERLIDVHNEDETSHIGEGRSLEQHKASEVIDHPALSLVADKYSDGSVGFIKNIYSDKNTLDVNMANSEDWLDVLVGTGSNLAIQNGYANIFPGNAVDDYAMRTTENWNYLFVGDTDVNPFYAFTALLDTPTKFDAYLGFGNQTPEDEDGFVGFYWNKVNQEMKAKVTKFSGTDVSSDALTFDKTLLNSFMIEVLEGGAVIKFYINNILVFTFEEAAYSFNSETGPTFKIIRRETGFCSMSVGSFSHYQNLEA